jgi:uncharacterized protein (TIGR02284 family)
MTNATALLNDLIEVARDGQRFYMEAATKVDSPQLKDIFRDLARVREELITDLDQHVLDRGQAPSTDKTIVGTLRKTYAKLLATITRDNEKVYIDELEEAEDRLLAHYREALAQAPSESVRSVLQQHLLTVEAAHDAMRALKEQVESP